MVAKIDAVIGVYDVFRIAGYRLPPGYETIGTWAPALLLLARLFQGLSVGGEYGTSATYMSEVAVEGRKGFYASFQYVTLIGGQLLALLVVVVLQHTMEDAALREWDGVFFRVRSCVSCCGVVVTSSVR